MLQPTKHVAITGGGSGIGLATAKLYLRQGDRVSVISRTASQETRNLQEQYPDCYFDFKGDVSSVEELESFFLQCTAAMGKLDVVVANAGIATAENISAVTEESFQEAFDINVKGTFFTIQKSLPHLNPNARITLISSVQASRGAGVWAVYGATKAAVRSLTRSFAAELGQQNIRVNCVSPGVTATPILQKFGFDDDALVNIVEQVKSATPLGRLGEPDEIAQAVAFISSEAANFITGADLQVDGGLTQI